MSMGLNSFISANELHAMTNLGKKHNGEEKEGVIRVADVRCYGLLEISNVRLNTMLAYVVLFRPRQ